MKYRVNNALLQYRADGETTTGANTIVLDNHIDLAKNVAWSKAGFTTERLFDENLFQQFEKNTNELLTNLWTQADLKVSNNFQLDQYHKLIEQYSDHLRAVDKTKLLAVADFPVD